MFRHDDVTEDAELVIYPRLFQGAFELDSRGGCAEFGLASVTTEGDEMKVAGLLVPVEV